MKIGSKALQATFSNYGARLLALEVDGVDVVFGTSLDPSQELLWDPYAGITCGRHAGRISRASFKLNGVSHKLVENQNGFQLHGGPRNFGNTRWRSRESSSEIEFSHISADGDQGYPGELHTKAIYGVKDNIMWAELTATTTKPTVINLTNHAYWNLVGQSAGKDAAFSQEIQINATKVLAVDERLLPTGELLEVSGTRFDFQTCRKVDGAFDDCFCLSGRRGSLKEALKIRDPNSGRRMEVWTTENAIQFYTAAHWNDGLPSKGRSLQQHQAIAIEPQNTPDAPNHAHFPSSVLDVGATYRNRIEWRFS